MNHLDDFRLVFGRSVAIHEELDRVARMDAELVGVSGNLHPTHGFVLKKRRLLIRNA
jgi:hypothetical protein